METEKPKNYIIRYIIYTYGLFVILLVTLGGTATILLHKSPLAMRWLIAVTAWTPTYVFLLMFKKLYPNRTVKDFYKKAFIKKLNFHLLVVTTLIQLIIFIFSICMVSNARNIEIISLLDFSYPTVISAFFFTLIQGATGEETGWRGYLLPSVEKKFGVINSSLIVSLIWSFWHAPIWFLGTGYSGEVLIKYIIVFIICITCLGFIMGICYHWCKTLLVPAWMHFTFNFLGELFTGSLVDLVSCYALLYLITAAGFLIFYVFFKRNDKKLLEYE